MELYVVSGGGANLTPAANLPDTFLVDTTAPATPALDVSSGSYALPFYVTAESSDPGLTDATLYYTTDASVPSSSSALFTSPYIVGTAQTLTLIRIDAAGNESPSVAYVYSEATGPTVSIDNADPVTPTNTSVALTSTNTNVTYYQWSVESGPGTTSLGTVTSMDTTFTGAAGVEANYLLRLTGTGSSGTQSSDEIVIQWDDLAPRVGAGADTGTVGATTIITPLIEDASAISSILWSSTPAGATFGDATTATTTVSGDAGAGHTVNLGGWAFLRIVPY